MDPDDDANFTCNDLADNCSNNDFYTTCVQNGTLFELLATVLNVYYTPILILFGCLGNLISIFVFYTSKLRLQSTSVYLSALALSDTLFLLQLFPPLLNSTQLSNVFYEHGVCQVVVYISYVSCFCSTWTVVAFTVERFVAVLYPLQRGTVCSVRRAKYTVLTVLVVALTLNIPVLRFTTPSVNECNVNREYLNDAARFNLVDTIISFSVPLGAIVVLNTRIMMGVCKVERARHQLVKAEEPPGRTIARVTRSSGTRSQTRVTKMLLLVSSVFVVLNLPAYTMRIMAYTYDMNRELLGDRWAAYQQLAMAFFNTNFGINFMLYCLSGQNFRRALWQAIPCLRRRAQRAAIIERQTTTNPARGRSVSTSYASAATGGMSLASINVEEPAGVRHQRTGSVIKRWKFDNSRQRNGMQQQQIEMATYKMRNTSTETQETT